MKFVVPGQRNAQSEVLPSRHDIHGIPWQVIVHKFSCLDCLLFVEGRFWISPLRKAFDVDGQMQVLIKCCKADQPFLQGTVADSQRSAAAEKLHSARESVDGCRA